MAPAQIHASEIDFAAEYQQGSIVLLLVQQDDDCQRTPPFIDPSNGICLPRHFRQTPSLQLPVYPSTLTANSIPVRGHP